MIFFPNGIEFAFLYPRESTRQSGARPKGAKCQKFKFIVAQSKTHRNKGCGAPCSPAPCRSGFTARCARSAKQSNSFFKTMMTTARSAVRRESIQRIFGIDWKSFARAQTWKPWLWHHEISPPRLKRCQAGKSRAFRAPRRAVIALFGAH